MRIDITPGRGRTTVGPPSGPTETIPASVTVTIADTLPYNVEVRLEWSPSVGKLAIRKVCCTAVPGGDDVSPIGIARIALRDTVQSALETEYLGATGWPGLLDKHHDHNPLAVDALIYLLAVAFQSPKPTATVALARGLSPASGPKRVLAARKAGLLHRDRTGQTRRSVSDIEPTQQRRRPGEVEPDAAVALLVDGEVATPRSPRCIPQSDPRRTADLALLSAAPSHRFPR